MGLLFVTRHIFQTCAGNTESVHRGLHRWLFSSIFGVMVIGQLSYVVFLRGHQPLAAGVSMLYGDMSQAPSLYTVGHVLSSRERVLWVNT